MTNEQISNDEVTALFLKAQAMNADATIIVTAGTVARLCAEIARLRALEPRCDHPQIACIGGTQCTTCKQIWVSDTGPPQTFGNLPVPDPREPRADVNLPAEPTKDVKPCGCGIAVCWGHEYQIMCKQHYDEMMSAPHPGVYAASHTDTCAMMNVSGTACDCGAVNRT